MTDLENYSDRLWKNAYERGKAETIKAILQIIDEAQTYKMAVGSTDLFIDREAFRDEVLALKGGEHEGSN